MKKLVLLYAAAALLVLVALPLYMRTTMSQVAESEEKFLQSKPYEVAGAPGN